LILKSGPLTATNVEGAVDPLVAVTVTLNMPRAEETVSMEVADVAVADSITLAELSMVVALPDGTVAERLAVPENP
jgi:hypothetical protein